MTLGAFLLLLAYLASTASPARAVLAGVDELESSDPPERILADFEKSWRMFAATRGKHLLY